MNKLVFQKCILYEHFDYAYSTVFTAFAARFFGTFCSYLLLCERNYDMFVWFLGVLERFLPLSARAYAGIRLGKAEFAIFCKCPRFKGAMAHTSPPFRR